MRISDWSSDVCSSDLGCIEQRGAAARDNAFLNRGAGGMERVVDAVLAFLALDFGGPANLDHGHAAGQLGEAFLALFTVVVARGSIDLRTDFIDARLDVFGIPRTIDVGGVELGRASCRGRVGQ